MIITNTIPLITDAFPKHLLGLGLGANVLVVSASALIGPVLGDISYTTLAGAGCSGLMFL
jgi:hypothetical protein